LLFIKINSSSKQLSHVKDFATVASKVLMADVEDKSTITKHCLDGLLRLSVSLNKGHTNMIIDELVVNGVTSKLMDIFLQAATQCDSELIHTCLHLIHVIFTNAEEKQNEVEQLLSNEIMILELAKVRFHNTYLNVEIGLHTVYYVIYVI